MMKENNRNSNGEVLLTDVPNKLREARNIATNVPYELHDFADYLADVTNDQIVPMGMMMLLVCAMDDLQKERCGFAKKVPFPEDLKKEKFQIAIYLSYFPLIVDKIASKEFAEEFRTLFTQTFGKAQPPVDENKEDFGVVIIEDGVVDISNKDKAEVLAALYNNSHPHGMGFLQYNPEPMTIEQARELLKQTTDFDYLAGRVMKISLESNIVRTRGYNMDNGKGAAERAISQCHNIQ
ncbi:MAG: hypothetical protein J6D03_04005 [Clostridia bacterium]|nr:hypothetical protein [Clostridia bacterium]